jgi:hypothetical protein
MNNSVTKETRMLAPEIAKAQAEYAAKPFSVYLRTDRFSGTFRFDTHAEAVRYVADQSANYHKNRRYGRHSTWWAELNGPGLVRFWDDIDITDGIEEVR